MHSGSAFKNGKAMRLKINFFRLSIGDPSVTIMQPNKLIGGVDMTILARAMIFFIILTVAPSFASEKVEPPSECGQCGMDRDTFAHGRMLIEYADGTSSGTCSLNCAAVEMNVNKGKKVKSLKVADYISKKLIDAKGAIWVIGGSQPGIMTEMPKWAFKKKDDARRFIKEYGGRITGYDEALNLALLENQ
jgi:nitrous oxide reductase accessory protein NosL